jgi:hypothetical protein
MTGGSGHHALAPVLTGTTKYTCGMTHVKQDSATPTSMNPDSSSGHCAHGISILLLLYTTFQLYERHIVQVFARKQLREPRLIRSNQPLS